MPRPELLAKFDAAIEKAGLVEHRETQLQATLLGRP